MIYMDKRHLEIVKNILKKYPYTFYAFGSRAKGTQRPLSDLDLCFMENIPWNVRSHIDEDFEESDLPFTVDVVDWNSCSEDFKAKIKNDLIQISP
jgi:predicted nucleotidyltransferase